MARSVKRACPWLAAGLMTAALTLPASPWARAQDEAVVAEDEVVVAEDAPAEGEIASTAPQEWNPPLVHARSVGGETYWQRQSSDAFLDPDQRLNLVPKYVFVLPDPNADLLGSFRQGPALADGQALQLKSGVDAPALAGIFPCVPSDAGRAWQWLDYEDGAKAHLLVGLVSGQADAPAQLFVARLAAPASAGQIDRIVAQREVPAAEIIADVLPGGALDTFDRPAEYGSRKTLVGRVIAVLKRHDGHYAVDFAGENLHPDSDCRVWLSPVEHDFGHPVAIRFVSLPIQRDSGKISPVTVLSVVYRGPNDKLHQIAIDFPLCSSPLLAQLRQLADQARSTGKPGARASSADQATALLGEDLAEELARRLVNGIYR
ncbi:MAG: hypothetical protein K1X74_17610 [Pirellulales bacterium]|nr:hypothetical protein [Pirellulales bacterium]